MSSKGGVRPPTPPYCSAKAERCERSVATSFDKPTGAAPGVAPPNGAATLDNPTGAAPGVTGVIKKIWFLSFLFLYFCIFVFLYFLFMLHCF